MNVYRALVKDCYYFESLKKGTPGIAFMFDIQYDCESPTVPVKKPLMRGNMWLSDAAVEYTLENIKDVFGYIGELGAFIADDSHWLNVECDIVVDLEQYTGDDGNVRQFDRIKFINRPNGAAMTNDKIATEEAIKRLGKFRGKVTAWQQAHAQSGDKVPAAVREIASIKAAKKAATETADSDLPF